MGNDTINDKAFHRTFSEPRNALGMLRELVPAHLAKMIRWDTLRLASSKYVDLLLRERRSDLVYQAELAGRDIFIYLIEHQSSVDLIMAVRIYTAIGQLWDGWRREHPNSTTVPAVLPLVVYHGDRAWTAATEVSDLIDLPADVREAMSEYLPQQRFVLDDLSAASAESIREREQLTATARLTLAALQFLRAQCEQPAHVLRELWPLVEELRRLGLQDDFWVFIRYVSQVVPRGRHEEVRRYMQDHMTEAEYGRFLSIEEGLRSEGRLQGRQEGRQEGREEGRRETLTKLLIVKFGGELPADVVERLEQAVEEDLDLWTERVLTAETLDAVFRSP